MVKSWKQDWINPRVVATLHMPLRKHESKFSIAQIVPQLLNYLPKQIPTLLKGFKQNQALSNVELKIPGM